MKITVGKDVFNLVEFRNSFIPAFCVTVYKYQGADIDEPYNIYDVNLMDKKQLYTALSRPTKFEYIHLDNKKINSCYRVRRQPYLGLVNSRWNSLYKNGKIYKVEVGEKIYIGSTCEDLETRLSWHLSNPKSAVYKYRKNKPQIHLLENAPSCDKNPLKRLKMSI